MMNSALFSLPLFQAPLDPVWFPWGLQDTVTTENGTHTKNEVIMREEDLAVYAMIGPSIKMDRQFFQDAKATGKPIHRCALAVVFGCSLTRHLIAVTLTRSQVGSVCVALNISVAPSL
jgi:hypothetical protein